MKSIVFLFFCLMSTLNAFSQYKVEINKIDPFDNSEVRELSYFQIGQDQKIKFYLKIGIVLAPEKPDTTFFVTLIATTPLGCLTKNSKILVKFNDDTVITLANYSEKIDCSKDKPLEIVSILKTEQLIKFKTVGVKLIRQFHENYIDFTPFNSMVFKEMIVFLNEPYFYEK